jgi:4-amino-4-deoxy-L-arabinose transferase-like glycosyltransferase
VSVAAATKPAARARRAPHSFGFWLAVIVALGVAIRVVHTLLVAPWPPLFFNDEAYYRTLARLVAHGVGFVRPAEWFADHATLPTAERPPLYPLLLAGLDKLGGTSPDAQRLLGALTGAGAIVAVGLLARRLTGPRAGLLAAAMAALYPTLIAADGALMTESVYGLLASLMLLAAYRLLDAPGFRRAVVLGALGALAALARGEALLLLPLLLLPLLRRPGGVRAAGAACLAFVVVLAPWTVRNLVAFDRPVLVATTAGETLAGANCDPAYYGEGVGRWEVTCVHFSGRGNEAVELEKAGRGGLRYALDHAGRLPVVMLVRLGRTWGAYEPFQRPEGRAGWVTRVGVVVYFLLVPLAAYGLLVLRRRGVPAWIVAAPLLTVTVTTLLAYGNPRFRHPAELVLVVLAAVALDAVWRRATVRPARGPSTPGRPLPRGSGSLS